MKSYIRRLSPASVIAILAVVVATSGTAYAVASQNGDTLITPHTLSGDRLRPHTVTRSEMSKLAWGGVILQNGWANGSRSPSAAIDAQGIVHLRGAVTGGESALIGTLPKTDSPTATIYLGAQNKRGGTVGIIIERNGAIVVQGTIGPNMFVSLDGLTFAR